MNARNLKSIKKFVVLVLIAALPGTAFATDTPQMPGKRTLVTYSDGSQEIVYVTQLPGAEITIEEPGSAATIRGIARNQAAANRAAYEAYWNNHYSAEPSNKLGNLNKDGTMDNEKTLKQGPSGSRGNGIGETNSQ